MKSRVALALVTGLLVALLPHAAGQAQAPQRQAAAEMLRELERESRRLDTRTPASRYEQILAAAQAEGDRWTEAAVRRTLGTVLRSLGQQQEARAHLESAARLYEALRDHNGLGWTLSELGWTEFENGRAEEANRVWVRGTEAFDAAGNARGRAELMHNRCFALPPGPEKRALLDEGLALARRIGDLRVESQFLYKLGEQQAWDGDFAAALVTLERAVAGFEKVGHDAAAARVLIPLGRIHWSHGRPERGLEIYQRAHDIFERLGERAGMVQALAAMASGHHMLGRLNEAIDLQQRALRRSIEIGTLRNINIQRLHLAKLFLQRRDARKAKALVDEVLATEDTFGRKLAHAPLAEVLFALGDFDGAHRAATEAIRLTAEPVARPHMLAFRARVEEKLGRNDRALDDVARALEEIERFRPRLVQTDPMKQGFGERLQRVFEYAVDLRARLGRYDAALEAAEQARGRAFLDLLATRHGLPMATEPDGVDPAAADGKSVVMEALRAEWRTADPELESSVAAEPFSLARLTAAAARLDTTIVEYWVGPERTIVWVVRRDGLTATAMVPAGAERLAELVRAASDAAGSFVGPAGPDAAAGASAGMALVRHSAPKQTWRVLHDLLIRPVAAALPRTRGALVTIVPHGPLARLPFAALLDERGRYLLERYALHYVPAGALLEHTARTETASSSIDRYLLVADPARTPAASGGRMLPPLPHAAREVRQIASALPPASVVRLTGPAAAEDRVRVAMTGSLVLHFATHAVLRDDRSLESFLALGPSADSAFEPRDTRTDGRLTAHEIYALKLQANLVVLSACRTAAGPVTGDGIVGLTRAFFYAGTPSVIATLWNLADVSGAYVMPAFYRAWRSGKDKGRALREAQLALLARLRTGTITIDSPAGKVRLEEDPFLWAAYVLVGKP